MSPRPADVAQQRLRHQGITRHGARRPADLVAWLGAVQAQEFGPACWGLGLRLRNGVGLRDIERAVDEGRILRTHVMRPTWHFVARDDIRWMLDLTGPRVQRAVSSYNRRLGLDESVLRKSLGVIERALAGGRHLTRLELRDHLQRRGLVLDTQRLAHVVGHAEIEGVVCSGPRRGSRFTYALIAERAPKAVRLSRDEALATLCRRYFRSHGPATVRDFVWWSGLTTADAKRGLEMIRAERRDVDALTYWTAGPVPDGITREEVVHLLPIYDEYLVAYRDRVAVPHGPATIASTSRGPVTFQHAVIVAGQVGGTWRIGRRADGVRVEVTMLRPLTLRARRGLADATAQYEAFIGVPVTLAVT